MKASQGVRLAGQTEQAPFLRWRICFIAAAASRGIDVTNLLTDRRFGSEDPATGAQVLNSVAEAYEMDDLAT
jgi:electron transfer flavoprotein alpha/beta subunit